MRLGHKDLLSDLILALNDLIQEAIFYRKTGVSGGYSSSYHRPLYHLDILQGIAKGGVLNPSCAVLTF